jgi:hypothetical protein
MRPLTKKVGFMKKYLIGLLLLSTTSVFAAGSGNTPSYDMFAPRPGGSEFKAGISLLSSETTTSGVATKGSGYGLGLEYAHAFMGDMSFFFEQNVYGYKYDTSGVASEIKTFSPTTIGIKGLRFFGNPYLFYSAAYKMALLEKRDDANGINVFSNSDLRDNLNVAGGFGVPFGMFSAGAKLNYFLFQDSDYVASGITIKNKSGSGMNWRLFGQFDMGNKFGFAYSEETIDSYNATVAGITSSVGKSETKSMQFYGIVGFGNTDLMFDVTKNNLKDESAYSKYDSYLVTVAAKFNF